MAAFQAALQVKDRATTEEKGGEGKEEGKEKKHSYHCVLYLNTFLTHYT